MANHGNSLSQIEHIVVLMMENRSFDNLLGWLYDPDNNEGVFKQKPPSNFEGLYGKDLWNPGPDGKPIPVGRESWNSPPINPCPDPGETYQDVYSQLYNVTPVPSLHQVPPNPPQPPGMQGFVNNYSVQPPVIEHSIDPSIIMDCFTPKSVPVLSSLAYYYGICDHWFASIPTETLCNRSFVHAGTSSGHVNNFSQIGIPFVNRAQTIFNLLEGKKTWKVYSGCKATSLAVLTQMQLWPYAQSNLALLQDFVDDAQKSGALPNYAFIEPMYMDSPTQAQNDMHPETRPGYFFGPSNLSQGEALLYNVYEAVRKSPDWNSILLIILFDEHGGCYDHVPPPSSAECEFAISPDDPHDEPGESGFQFNRLGVRVPAIIVSPFTPPQTILNEYFDHTSVLSTIVNCFDLPKEQLGNRQSAAPDVSSALTLSTPRVDFPPIPLPQGLGAKEPQEAPTTASQAEPLSDLQKTILRGIAYMADKPSTLWDPISKITTVSGAAKFLENKESDLLELLAQKPKI